jgi:hypothetical protein
MNDQQTARMILALAAEDDDDFIWDQLRTLTTEMFAVGPVAIKFAYFGREGSLQTRPFISTRWINDADDMADLIDLARANCVCGCYVQIHDILSSALQETQQEPVQAVVIVGDNFHGNLDAAVATANELRAAGTRLFLFQQGSSSKHPFRRLAEATEGAYFSFNGTTPAAHA